MIYRHIVIGLFVLTAGVSGPSVYAGPYSDALSKCLVSSTTTDDRVLLVKWMFSAASAHPAVRSIASVTPEQLDEANRQTAHLFEKLLTDTCRKEAKEAIKYEGEATLSVGFQVLGQVAGRELFANEDVVKNMSGLDKYVDRAKLQALSK